ncbi:MAG TPA: helix-turn-helix transcriptional regulator [Trichocoleus sp.]|jgi:transcriptional regulator with XRE-family HTH domain
MSLRELRQRELRLLRFYTCCQFGMTPQAFYAKWNVSHAQIALICGCSQSTVDRWFSQGTNRRSPSAIHLRRLAEMDLLWECYEAIPLALRQRICSTETETH